MYLTYGGSTIQYVCNWSAGIHKIVNSAVLYGGDIFVSMRPISGVVSDQDSLIMSRDKDISQAPLMQYYGAETNPSLHNSTNVSGDVFRAQSRMDYETTNSLWRPLTGAYDSLDANIANMSSKPSNHLFIKNTSYVTIGSGFRLDYSNHIDILDPVSTLQYVYIKYGLPSASTYTKASTEFITYPRSTTVELVSIAPMMGSDSGLSIYLTYNQVRMNVLSSHVYCWSVHT